MFGESVGVSAVARNRFWAHARPCGAEMRKLKAKEIVDIIGHVRDSAPGPES